MGGLVVGIWIIIWIIRASSNSRKSATGKPRGSRHNSLALIVFLIWVGWYFVCFLCSISDKKNAAIISVLFACTVMQPALWSHLAIRLGWVRAAYFCGRSAWWVNRRSLVGGGLFYGWRALQRHRGDARRYQAGLVFLQGRLDRNANKIDSGALLMQFILQRDGMEEERFYKRLSSMGHMDMDCAPRALTRYAFRLLAAHALARGDWKTLMSAIPDWRKNAFIPLANELARQYQRLRPDKPGNHRSSRKQPRWAARLPAVSGVLPPPLVKDDVSGEALRQQSWALADAAVPETLAQCWMQELQAPHWRERAQQLGCRNVDAALAGLRQSVDAWLERAATHAAGATPASAETDRIFEMLRFKTRAIDNRQSQRKLLSGSVEFEEFLSLMDLFEQLAGDPVLQHQAYGIFEYPVWNWMAALWNQRREKWLAYYVCARMHPHAQSVGSDAARVYGQILRGEVR